MLTILSFTALLFALIFVLVTSMRLFMSHQAKSKQEIQSAKFLKTKYKGAELRPYYSTILLIGFVFALGIVIVAFSWTTYESLERAYEHDFHFPEDEVEVQLTASTIYRAPQPPSPAPPIINEIDEEKSEEEEEKEEKTVIEIDLPDEFKPGTVLNLPEPKIPDEPEIYDWGAIEEYPEFPGGESALLAFIATIQYPRLALENGIEGNLRIAFVINEEGYPENFEVIRGSDRLLNDAAINHLKRMPRWTPGYHGGRAVKVRYSVPVRFVISR